jgi:hypothetical protein
MTNPATTQSLADMRAEVARVKARLADLDEFQAVWNEYARKLREIVGQMGAREAGDSARVTTMLAAAETDRIKVVSQAPVKYDPNFIHTALADLTDYNLRTQAEMLFATITEPVDVEQWGAWRKKHVVTANALEARLGEADGAIERKRTAMRADLRAKELVVAEHERGPADAVTLRALAEKWVSRVPFKPLRRFLWSAVLEHTRAIIGAFLFAALLAGVHYCAPGVERKARDLWRQRTATDSGQTAPR